MIKKMAIKKFTIIALSFLILLIVYLFPKKHETYNFTTNVSYVVSEKMPIYLILNDSYVSRCNVLKTSDNLNDLVKEVIENLTIDSNNTNIPKGFKKVIPKNTKVKDISISDGLLKINFSKEVLNVSLENEEKMLEAIIYSLTEIKDVNKIMIFVEGELLKNLPNSKKILPNILDRSYGINKTYDISSFKDVTKVTTYYVSKNEDNIYYTPVTSLSNDKKEKIEIIIEKLKSNPTYNTNLVSYLTNEAKLLQYKILENSVNVSFNNEILSLDSKNIIEEIKYSVALSIKDTYMINETVFYVDGVLVDAFFV